MKYPLFLLYIAALSCNCCRAQQTALRTNLLLWSTTTPNAGVEFGMGRHFTFGLTGAYNAWKFSNSMKLNLYFAQPEFRYWPCRSFEGHFIGIHGHYGHYNVGQFPFVASMKDLIYRGDLYGGGISYGYHWALGLRWGLEVSVGAGYARMEYDKYRCVECGELEGSYRRNYFGPTRADFSLIYFIR